MKNNALWLMGGIPNSGKSTAAKKFADQSKEAEAPVEIVSRDKIRFSLLRDGDPYFSRETEVFETFINEINNKLRSGSIVIADATHLNKASRAKLMRRISKDYPINIMWVSTSMKTCLTRNETRKGTRAYVPVEQIIDMKNNLVYPTLDEGFEKIVIISGEDKKED